MIYILAPPKLLQELDEQRVHVGDTLKLKIPISGKGPFTFKLKKDDEPISADDRIKVQELDDHIIITISGLLSSNS